MFHEIQAIGRLGGDPTVREFEDGGRVATFSLAVNDNYKNKAGEKVERTVWFRCSAWGARGDVMARYLHKGDPVRVVGRMRFDEETGGPRIWTDDSGNPRASYEISVDSFTFLPGGKGGSGDSGSGDEFDEMAASFAGTTSPKMPF